MTQAATLTGSHGLWRSALERIAMGFILLIVLTSFLPSLPWGFWLLLLLVMG